MNRTKIICTLGPSVDTEERIEELVNHGMSVARMNCSHGDMQTRLAYLQKLRKVESKLKKPIAVMLDLQGPKLRVGDLPKPFNLKHQDIWQLSGDLPADEAKKIIPIGIKNLGKSVSVGGLIFMDDGLIKMEVTQVKGHDIWVRIVHGGVLESRKGINIPFYKGKTSVLSEKDKEDLIWGLKHSVDFIALSFVRSAKDIWELRAFIKHQNPQSSS